MFVNKL